MSIDRLASGTSVRVAAVVITYEPDTGKLSSLLLSLGKQVSQFIVVDNTPLPDDRVRVAVEATPELGGNVQIVRLGENLGIAAALNVGVRSAIVAGAEYVLLSDQDSLPAPNMVEELLRVAIDRQRAGIRVGGVGPVYVDNITGQTFGFQVQDPRRLFYSVRDGGQADPWVEIVTGISSGMLVPVDVFAAVGGMREDYFIDYVDTEWCHRARHAGYTLFGTSRARMNHHLGDDTFPVWYLRWRPFSSYSPLRLYYRFCIVILLM
jgi:rhamnosyltransferase